jgi:putative transposase
VPESFFHTLKAELIHHQIYQTRDESRQAVLSILRSFITASDCIQLMATYSPLDFELQHKAA